MENLILRDVDRIVDNEIHLKDIHLEFKPGSRYILLGRTLAGKTSLLRVLAGLDRPTSGTLIEGNHDITGVSVRKRSVAMVYQQFINYPTLTVFDNIASPLRFGGLSKETVTDKVHETAAMLRIEDLLDRYPSELSGGQQQRTAIARALVKEADILLLDEPLVNLDYKLREELREELQSIFKTRKSVVVYTTTEPSEALMFGGNIVVLDKGRVLQEGDTSFVFRNPASVRVSQVFSDPPVNVINGTLQDGVIRMGEHTMTVKGHLRSLKNGEYLFGIRPNHLSLRQKHPEDIRLNVSVELTEISGSESFIHSVFYESPLVIQEEGIHRRRLGEIVNVYINPEMIFAFDRSGSLAAAPLDTISVSRVDTAPAPKNSSHGY